MLGIPHLFTFGNLAFFNCGGVRLMLSAEPDRPPQANIIYFRFADIAAAHAALQDGGVSFLRLPHCIHRHADRTDEWMAFFSDNEDRPLALMSQVRAD